MATTVVNVDSAVTLSVTSGSGISVATASATNLVNPVYQFWTLPNGEWVSSGGYTSTNTYTLPKNTGTSAATYHVIGYAKDAAAPESAAYEVSTQVVAATESPS
jgi:hypothetical protein